MVVVVVVVSWWPTLTAGPTSWYFPLISSLPTPSAAPAPFLGGARLDSPRARRTFHRRQRLLPSMHIDKLSLPVTPSPRRPRSELPLEIVEACLRWRGEAAVR